jgi:Arc/MetJ family transcription regulator
LEAEGPSTALRAEYRQIKHQLRHHLMLYSVYIQGMETFPVRTTVNIDDELLARAQELTGIEEKATLLREGLRALVEREAARRLAALGGSQPDLAPTPRRRAPRK